MGRLALAGLHPEGMSASRYTAAVWALYLEYLTKFGEDAQTAVEKLWSGLASAFDQSPGQSATATQATAAAPRASRAPSSGSSPTRPGDKRTGRPSKADIEAWALASAQAGNNFIGDMPRGNAGAADRVGG